MNGSIIIGLIIRIVPYYQSVLSTQRIFNRLIRAKLYRIIIHLINNNIFVIFDFKRSEKCIGEVCALFFFFVSVIVLLLYNNISKNASTFNFFRDKGYWYKLDLLLALFVQKVKTFILLYLIQNFKKWITVRYPSYLKFLPKLYTWYYFQNILTFL